MQEELQENLEERVKVYTVWETTDEDMDWRGILMSDDIDVAVEELVTLLVVAKPGTTISISVNDMSVEQFEALEDKEEHTIH